MQTLGLADSTPRSESRLKSLFWPSIKSAADVDYLGTQGYWLCTVVALLTLLLSAVAGHPVAGVAGFFFYYLSGVGIRERSRYAAAMAFLFALAELLVLVAVLPWWPSVFRVLVAAVLFSNLRGTRIAAGWKAESEEAALPPRLGETWADKFSDQLPSWLWPKVRITYYILSMCFVLFMGIGIGVMISRGLWPPILTLKQ